MIPKETIEEIRKKADIVKVVSEYVQLRKRGKNYLGLCPFHSEKTPSFTVSEEKQIFHCFGCNEGGNAFSFIMKIENISFVEAAEDLGAKLDINVPKSTNYELSKGDKDKLFQVTLMAGQYFQTCLNGNDGEIARKYLNQRNITDKTRELFYLGVAPIGWDNLFKHLIARGVSPALIEKSGLILAREGGGGYYDRFRNRLIFPIVDQRDRLVAFGGRSLGDEEPKYLNSSDTQIYHKGETLFGLNLTKDNIKKHKTAIMVEGYFDLITPFKNGVQNIVATLGTALTISQCKLLARYADTIVLAFDADAAGGVAAERSIELLRDQGLKVKVAQLISGKDPDEAIQKSGPAGFSKCIESALPFLEFRIKRILARYNLAEIEARAKALQEIATILGQESDPYIQKEYAKLAASWLKTDADTILATIKRSQHYSYGGRNSLQRMTEKPGSRIEEAEINLIALAAQSKEALETLKQRMSVEDFKLAPVQAIVALIFASDFKDDDSPLHFLLDNLEDEEARRFLSRNIMDKPLGDTENKEKILNDCLMVLNNERQKHKVAGLKLAINQAEKSGQSKEVAKLLVELNNEISW